MNAACVDKRRLFWVLCFGVSLGGSVVVEREAAASAVYPARAITAYYDTANKTHRVFAYQRSGWFQGAVMVMSFTDGSSSGWSCGESLPACNVASTYWCSSTNTGEFANGGNIASAYDGTFGHLYYIAVDGTLWEAWGNPPTIANSHSLTHVAGGNPPLPAGSGNSSAGWITNAATLGAAYVPGGGQYVFYQATDGNIHTMNYWGGWWDWIPQYPSVPPTALSGQGLTSLWDGTRLHVFFDDVWSAVEEFYSTDLGSTWQFGLWNAGPGYPVGFMTSSATPNGYEFLAGTSTTSGDVAQTNFYDYSPYGSGGAAEPAYAGGPVLGIWAGPLQCPPGWNPPCGDALRFYVGSDGNIYETPAPGGYQAINVAAGAPPVENWNTLLIANQSPLTGYWDAVAQSVTLFYIANDGQVHELYTTDPGQTHWATTTVSGCAGYF